MVPDCFIMSDAPYYLDIFIVHNHYPSPLTLPLPSPSFPPTNKTHRFSTNCATRIVPFLNGGAPWYLDIFREGLDKWGKPFLNGGHLGIYFPRGLNPRSTPPPPTLYPSPSFSPNKQNSLILDKWCNPYCPISQWGGHDVRGHDVSGDLHTPVKCTVTCESHA